MKYRKTIIRVLLILVPVLLVSLQDTGAAQGDEAKQRNEDLVTQGSMRVLGEDGKPVLELPLKHTSVSARISGYIARVDVTQTFQNPFKEKIEAVYVFPLPNRAAVDSMKMKIGERTIIAQIKRRAEAKKIYEEAKIKGHVAGLLEQERPNIFTQSVANIEPGKEIEVTISYVEELKYEDGHYQFVFPMVVGPRFIPGKPATPPEGGWSPDTDRVPDASRITPPVMKPGTRSGHDIDVKVELDAGVPVVNLGSKSHKVAVKETGKSTRTITLDAGDRIPNKDFILDYTVAGESPEVALLRHGKGGRGFFTLIIQPKAKFEAKEITPKEMIFIVDRSGSMNGFPIETVKAAMKKCLLGMNPDDTFQVIGFSNKAETFAPAPVPNTRENVAGAIAYIEGFSGGGGTHMLKGVQEAFKYPKDEKRLRIVFMMTDAYIGNEKEILRAVSENCDEARLFSFGVGSSVNRYLIDGMAELGRGLAYYARHDEDTSAIVEKFYEKISKPYLTDIEIDWGGLKVDDIYPRTIPDLFSAQPLVLHGRFTEAGRGKVVIKGKIAGKEWQRELEVEFPKEEKANDVLGTLWARTRIHFLGNRLICDLDPKEVEKQITDLALDFKLMSQYTSFVAVEEKIITEGGKPKKVLVPVKMPEGVSYRGVFGEDEMMGGKGKMQYLRQALAPAARAGGGAGGTEPRARTSVDELRQLLKPLTRPDGKIEAIILRNLALAFTTGKSYENSAGMAAAYLRTMKQYLDKDGGFNMPEEAEDPLKTQAFALWTLHEAYARCKDSACKEALQKTVERLLKLRDEKSGLWPAKAGGETPDPLTTAWAVLTLVTAKKAGFDFDEVVLASVIVESEKRWKEGDSSDPLWVAVSAFASKALNKERRELLLKTLEAVEFTPELKSAGQQKQFLLLLAALKLDEDTYKNTCTKILKAYGGTYSPLVRRMVNLASSGITILKEEEK